MDKKKIFGIIIFIIIGLFMFSFANPNEDVKLYDCGDEEKTKQEEVTDCVNEKMEEGTTEQKALLSCRKTYCNGLEDDNLDEDKNVVAENNENNNGNNVQSSTIVNTNNVTNGNQNIVDNSKEIELNNSKEQAVNELNQYYENLDFNEKNKEEAKNILKNGVNNINASESKEKLTEILEETKKELDNLLEKQELENYKEKTVNDVIDYANDLEVKEKDEIINNAKEQIENANGKENIDKIVEEVKEELNVVKEKEELELAKEKAIEEIKNYRNDYQYEEENEKIYDELLNKIINKINLSASIKEVTENLELGETKIDELISDDLSSYKEKSKEEINNYVDLNDYREKEQEEIQNILVESTNNISSSLTKEEIDEILSNTKQKIDNIKTDEELTIEETRYVTFVDYKGEVIEKQTLKVGESAIAPTITLTYASRNITYTFVGWDKDFTNVQGNIIVTPVYEITEIKANIYVKNEILTTVKLNLTEELKNIVNNNESTEISLDQTIILSMIDTNEKLPTLDNFYIYNYNAIKFENENGFVIDAEIVFDIESYKEKSKEEINNYVDLNDYREKEQEEIQNILVESTNNISSSLTKEEIDEILSNTKQKIDNIKTDEELTIEETRYVTFVDYKGEVIEKQPVKIGESATAPTTTLNYTSRYITYTFAGWDKDFTNVQENITVAPVYEITEILANIYVLKENNIRPSNGESLGVNAYQHLKTVKLNLTEELKNVVKENKKVVISEDNNTIISIVTSELPEAEQFYYYEYYVFKFEIADGFHIDSELMFDNVAFEEYKKSTISEIKNYLDSLELSDENKINADNILENATENINNSSTKEEIDSIKQNAISELKKILDSIKEDVIKEIENAINAATFTGSYVEKANIILESAKEEINNANSEDGLEVLEDKYLNEINNLIILSKQTFIADINTKNIFKLKKLSIVNIASDVIINKISYVYSFGIEDTKYINTEYHSSILLDEEIEDLLFGASSVKIEYTKDNFRYVNIYDIKRNILSSITGLELISTNLVK